MQVCSWNKHMLCLFVLSSLGLSWLSCFDSGPCTCHIQGFLDICIQHIQWLAFRLKFLFENYASLARGWLFNDLCVFKFTFHCELMEVFRLVRHLRLPSGQQQWTYIFHKVSLLRFTKNPCSSQQSNGKAFGMSLVLHWDLPFLLTGFVYCQSQEPLTLQNRKQMQLYR